MVLLFGKATTTKIDENTREKALLGGKYGEFRSTKTSHLLLIPRKDDKKRLYIKLLLINPYYFHIYIYLIITASKLIWNTLFVKSIIECFTVSLIFFIV